MAFADSLAAEPLAHTGTRCRIATVLAKMADDDAAALREALDDIDVTATRISRALKAEGFDVSDQAVRRHRNGCATCHSAKP